MPERKGRRDFRYRENIKTGVEAGTTIAEFMVEYGLPGILGGWLYFALPPAYINETDIATLVASVQEGYVLDRPIEELVKIYKPISDKVLNIDLGKLVSGIFSGGIFGGKAGVTISADIVKAIRIDYINRFLALALPLNTVFATLYQGILGTIAAPVTVALAGLVNLFDVKLELIEIVGRKPGNEAECESAYRACLATCGKADTPENRACREACAKARDECMAGRVRSFSFGTYRIAWHDRLVLAALEPTILVTLRKSLGEAAA